MIVGSVSTFIFLYIGRWLGDYLVKMAKQAQFDLLSDQWVRYITLAVFSPYPCSQPLQQSY